MQRASRALVANARAYVARLVGVLADAEADVEAVGVVAELARGGATGRASPCRPTPRRARARRAGSCRSRRSRAAPARGSGGGSSRAQNPALWRRTSMTAGSRHRRHFIARASRHRRAGSRRRRRRCRRSSWVASVSLRITSTDSGTTSRSREQLRDRLAAPGRRAPGAGCAAPPSLGARVPAGAGAQRSLRRAPGDDLEARRPVGRCVRYRTSASSLRDHVRSSADAGGDDRRRRASVREPATPRAEARGRAAGCSSIGEHQIRRISRTVWRLRALAPAEPVRDHDRRRPRRRPRSRSPASWRPRRCSSTSPCSSRSFASMSSRVILRSGTAAGFVLMLPRSSRLCAAFVAVAIQTSAASSSEHDDDDRGTAPTTSCR